MVKNHTLPKKVINKICTGRDQFIFKNDECKGCGRKVCKKATEAEIIA